MTTIYLETSAVLTWLFGEPRSEEVLQTVNPADVVVTSTLTYAEVSRALLRAETDTVLRGGEAQKLRGILERARTGWMAMAVSDNVLARASRPFPAEPVRTLDAIHLATALEFTRAFADLRVLSFDRRIRDNAEALGIL